MPIVTKKDQLSISMTWSPSDDSSEIDISVSRNGDDDVHITMSSGKNLIKFDPSCIVELHEFLVSKGIIDAPAVEEVDRVNRGAQMPAAADSASHDLISLMEEARRSSSVTHAHQGSPVVHNPLGMAPRGPAYASPAMVVTSASAVDLEPSRAVAPVVTGAASDPMALLNESESDNADDPIEMGEVPPDIFGR